MKFSTKMETTNFKTTYCNLITVCFLWKLLCYDYSHKILFDFIKT